MSILDKLTSRASSDGYLFDEFRPLATVQQTRTLHDSEYGDLWRHRLELLVSAEYTVPKGSDDEVHAECKRVASRQIGRVLYQDIHPLLSLIERAIFDGDRRAALDAVNRLRGEIDPRG